MPLINDPGNALTATAAEFVAPFEDLLSEPPEYQGPDFTSGFHIQEILEDGGEGVSVTLMGRAMPMQPFDYGGKQELVKEYYPGNPEPAVQVMGPRENNVPIRGNLDAKKYTRGGTRDYRQVPKALEERLTGIRERGNLCKFVLGEWVRYGFVEEASFAMKTLASIDYDLDLFIVGRAAPENCKVVGEEKAVPLEENENLIKAALDFQAQTANQPDNFPTGIGSQINDLIGDVASAVSVVTKFVDQTVSAAEGAQALAERAIGLVRHARSTIATFKRRVGQLDLYSVNSSADEATKALDKTANASYILEVQNSTEKGPPTITDAMKASAKKNASTYTSSEKTQKKALGKASEGWSVEGRLARLEEQFKKIARTLPKARHLIKDGDTLQKISMEYYGTSENWKRIYDHNNLTSTSLTVGDVLEIPKL